MDTYNVRRHHRNHMIRSYNAQRTKSHLRYTVTLAPLPIALPEDIGAKAAATTVGNNDDLRYNYF